MGTKGSGKTPFSRGHDGLLTREGAVREVQKREKNTSFAMSFNEMLKMINLPRQARDKHREIAQKRDACCVSQAIASEVRRRELKIENGAQNETLSRNTMSVFCAFYARISFALRRTITLPRQARDKVQVHVTKITP